LGAVPPQLLGRCMTQDLAPHVWEVRRSCFSAKLMGEKPCPQEVPKARKRLADR
jgi:hypothetical protein